MTIAFGTGAIAGGMPRLYIVVVSVWMSSAPMIEPSRVKRPPVSAVPPTTTAKIASSSMNSPTREESAALIFDVAISPASAAQAPENA